MGDRTGQYSIRVNDQWRVCFVWQDGDADDVEFRPDRGQVAMVLLVEAVDLVPAADGQLDHPVGQPLEAEPPAHCATFS